MDLNNIPLSPKDEEARKNALIAYILMLLGLFTGVFWLIGAIWAMVNAKGARDSIYYGHYQNIIGIFWWGLIVSIAGIILAIFLIGYLVLFAVWLWSIIKLVKGISRLSNGLPY